VLGVLGWFAGPSSTVGRRWPLAGRIFAAFVFVSFGVGKFVNHGSELASFRHYVLPDPDLLVYLVGALEIGGGILLAPGILTRLAAVVLAGDMVGAIIVSGFGRWESVSLTLAPVMLVLMIVLARVGAGRMSVDGWLIQLSHSTHASAARALSTPRWKVG
jgi:putative oxidoreductase